jgi:ribonuclease HII
LRWLGIDEAGRGCVLGDLVIAGFLHEGPDDEALRAAGAADSKRLTAKKRTEVRQQLAPLGEPDVRHVSATRIDDGNLNTLEEQVIVELVTRWRPDVVRLDALGHPRTLPALQARLQAQLPPDLQPSWTIEPKADHTYAVCGAASIFAKTTRDQALDDLREDFGDLGSGYPSDPVTRRWLESWARTGAPWPPFVRTRWATIGALAQQSLL